MNFDFGEVFTRAWHITWNNKRLWWLGFLPFFSWILFVLIVFLPLALQEQLDETVLLTLACGGLAIALFLIVLIHVAGQAVHTTGILRAEQNQENLPISELIRESRPFWWQYFGATLILTGGVNAIVMIVYLFVFLVGALTSEIVVYICFTPIVLLQYPVMFIWYVCNEQTRAAIFANNLGTLQAIEQSWQLFKKNLLGFGVICVVLYFGFNMISSFVMMPLMFPMFLFPFVVENENLMTPILAISGLCFVVLLPIALFVHGGVSTFMKSVWTLTYLRLTRPSEGSQPATLQPQGETA